MHKKAMLADGVFFAYYDKNTIGSVWSEIRKR